MKRSLIPLFLVFLMLTPTWAARKQLRTIAQDPYVSALVIDADSGKTLFESNADARLYPASVLKLMDLYVILDRIEQGALKLDEMVAVTVEAAKTGGSQVYLDPKEQFSVEDLLYALMVQSANDAAVALATHIAGSKEGFVALMNQKAKALGMNSTVFHSVHGLPPSEGQEPDITTARDMGLLCQALVKKPEALKYTATQNRGFRNNSFDMRNHNKLLTQYSGCDGLKTGYYQAAGFSIAATAKKGGVRIISLVMGSKDRKVRDSKAMELLSKGFSMVPPRPELAVPQPPITPPATSATVTADQPSSATTPGAQSSTTGEVSQAPSSEQGSTGKNSWAIFFIGLGAGCILFLGFLVIAGMVSKRRSTTIRTRYKTRD
ncbi:MAG: serine hydrolase [Desulfobulbus sp.]|nr:serine hydrolase [Desulfobulbus sp.]